MEENNPEAQPEKKELPTYKIELPKDNHFEEEKKVGVDFNSGSHSPKPRGFLEFMRVKDLKIVLYTTLVSYFIIFRIFITVLSLLSISVYSLMFSWILVLDLLGLYGARKLSLGLCIVYSIYTVLNIILKGAGIIYFLINLILATEEAIYVNCLRALVIFTFFAIFEVGQVYVQVKFCKKISVLSPEKSYLLERVIRGNIFPLLANKHYNTYS